MDNTNPQGGAPETPEKKPQKKKNFLQQDFHFSDMIPQKQAVDKTTMNLFIKEKNGNSLSVVIPTLIIVGVLVALFTKFAVIDRINDLLELQRQESELSARVSAMNDSLSDYDQVRSDYRHYSGHHLDADALSQVDRLEIIHLLERVVGGLGTISSIDIQGNTVSVRLTAPTLAHIARMRAILEAEEYVTKITVRTADRSSAYFSSPNAVTSSFVFTVSLPKEEG